MSTNPQLELAYQYVSQTRRHVYLTGKAGTGKTTFLHRVRREVIKHAVVVAPTGVAAINAKGVTIHSQFQLPFGLLKPGDTEVKSYKFSRKKREVLETIDLLIIDEISMVRADVLDGIDEVLRRFRRTDEPFGGVQLLMIGDLHQLPPVVKDHERDELLRRYDTPYFFGSRALSKAGYVTIELTKIYRQADDRFIRLLNSVRNNQLDEATLATLNERYQPDHQPAAGAITLTSHNFAANQINDEHLRRLPGATHDFTASIIGKFPASMYPNAEHLTFKVGAQVMFNRNDRDGAYYNGKIGRITAIEGQLITVLCPGDAAAITILPITWENIAYEMNKSTKEVEDNVIGSWTQHPLRLAWGITIHKSQGLTFERVTIDAADAFAHGQVYVALSRCKTLEGITLRSRIGDRSVKTDRVISDYSAANADNQPTDEELSRDKRAYQLRCLRDLFGCEALDNANKQLRRALFEHEGKLQAGGPADYRELFEGIGQLVTTGRTFLPALNAWRHPQLTEEQTAQLGARLAKAGVYFTEQVSGKLLPASLKFAFLTDNQAVKEAIQAKLDALRLALFVASKTFSAANADFDAVTYGKRRTAAKLDFNKGPEQKQRNPSQPTPTDVAHPELFESLRAWRWEASEERDIPAFTIAHNSLLVNLTNRLPRTAAELLTVPKVGPKTVERYGKDLLSIIGAYVRKHDIPPVTLAELAAKTPAKPNSSTSADTYLITLKMHLQGCSVTEIAAARKLTETTIESHLSRFVGSGQLAIADLMPQQDVDFLSAFLDENPEAPLGYIRHVLDNRFSYGQIRMVTEHKTWLQNGSKAA